MNEQTNYASILCDAIAKNRRRMGITQDALADKLGISYQAVSKWENGLSCPDITLLPQLARIFGITIDALFGMDEIHEPSVILTDKETPEPLTFLADDDTLRAVLFLGKRLVGKEEYKGEKQKITIALEGNAKNIVSDFSVTCNNVDGNISCGSISCDDVEGVISCGSISCGDVEGDISCATVSCDDVEGDINAARVTCNDVEGDIYATNGSVTVDGDVNGSITAETVMKKG